MNHILCLNVKGFGIFLEKRWKKAEDKALANCGKLSENRTEKKLQEAAPMTVTLTPEMEQLIQSKIQSGGFNSPSEVVYEGLRLLEQEKSREKNRFEALKQDIAVGIHQADNGQVKVFDAEEMKQRVRQELTKG
jgi:antitoxin ParD1/3/4